MGATQRRHARKSAADLHKKIITTPSKYAFVR